MNAIGIITVFHSIDDLLQTLGQHRRCRLSQVLSKPSRTCPGGTSSNGYLSGHLSASRFNRRFPALADWLPWLAEIRGETFATGEAFVIDSLPVPVCRRVRAWRWRKVPGRIDCGYCAAKNEKFFGWRLHWVCTPQGEPARFTVLPVSLHDRTPLHELADALPEGAHLFGAKGYISAPDAVAILDACGVRVIARPRDNMEELDWADEFDLRRYRHSSETVNSQLEKMGLECLYARTTPGFMLKVKASMFALACSSFD